MKVGMPIRPGDSARVRRNGPDGCGGRSGGTIRPRPIRRAVT
ncbi:hypothetical protein BSLA_01f1117 [Burkholderia stabilis]|nr:hypothetical protein BSLA_01f1117 [Burkholderia stabilis]